MHRTILRGTIALVASAGLLTAGVGPALAGGHDDAEAETVEVVGHGDSVEVSTQSVDAGLISFEVSSTNPSTADGGGSEITLFRLKEDRTLDDFFGHLANEFSTDPAVVAQATRDLKDDAVFRGLAEVVPNYPETVTEFLRPGTYYLMDLASQPPNTRPKLTTLEVLRNGHHHGDLESDVDVTALDDRFHAPDTWPAEGTYTFSNEDDTLHFMLIVPVKPGTTDDQVQAAFDDPNLTGPPDFAMEGPTGGNDVVSPGYRLQVSYDLPAGTYVLLCFVGDEETGMPHAVMGMHKVVVLE